MEWKSSIQILVAQQSSTANTDNSKKVIFYSQIDVIWKLYWVTYKPIYDPWLNGKSMAIDQM